MLEMCLMELIVGGPRLQFEFEQVLPGGEDPGATDPILDAIELRDRGQPEHRHHGGGERDALTHDGFRRVA